MVVSVSEKKLGDGVQTVAEDTLRLPAIFLDLDFHVVTVGVLAYTVALQEGDCRKSSNLPIRSKSVRCVFSMLIPARFK